MGKRSGFYAHTPGKGKDWHDLVSHLEQTAARARRNGAKFGAGEAAYLAGLWHDLGKFNPDFQEYLRRCEAASRNGEEPPAKGVQHAVYGAVLAWESAQPLASVIYGHHAGLPNRAKLQEVVAKTEHREVYGRLLPPARERVRGVSYEGEVRGLISDPPQDREEMGLFAELWLRMVFSALVDADFVDTEKHFEQSANVHARS